MSTRSSFNSLKFGDNIINRPQTGWDTTPINLTGSTGISWTDTVTFGENIQGWRERLRQGQSATTSMEGENVKAKFTPGQALWKWHYANDPGTFHIFTMTGEHRLTASIPTGNPSSVDETRANADAMGKFLRRSREIETAFQGGVFLGELAETLAMIRNPARGLRGLVTETGDILRNVRRLGVKNSLSRSRVTEQLADAWLELQFGWKPLLNDIDDGCKALKRLDTPQGLRTVRITASAKTSVVSNSQTAHYSQNDACWFVTADAIDDCMVIYRGAMRVEAKDAAELRADLFGFDPSNFLPTLYNLIPYTFLIDYFSNVGDIIEGWSQLGTRLAWCNRTTRKSLTQTKVSGCTKVYFDTINHNPFFPGFTVLDSLSFSPAKSVITKSVVSRAEFNQAMVPNLVFKIPSFGSLKWLNIAALVAGRNNDRTWVYGD